MSHPEAILLCGGRIVDPANGFDAVGDIGILDGRIVPPGDLPAGSRQLDVAGLVVAPGFIDVHVHLREPGQTHKETIASGSAAAAAGGFSTIVAMPNTTPPIDTPERVGWLRERADATGVVKVLPTGALSIGREGRDLTDARELKKAGVVALTDDGSGIQDDALMLAAMEQAAEVGLPVMDHCAHEQILAGGVVHAGEIAERLGLPGDRSITEELIVARNCLLAKETGWPVHIQHVSSAWTVKLLRMFQQAGVRVTAEATPHHLSLTHEACLEYGGNARMNPPLRTEEDRLAILGGVADGTISILATDHAPHADDEKTGPLDKVAAGIIGLEAAIPVCLTELVHSGMVSLHDFIARLTSGPRELLGLEQGTLSPGAPADITILDIDASTTIDVGSSRSLSRNCPYDGWECRGRVKATVVDGRFVLGPNL